MSKYYVVSRNGDKFDLVKIGDKTKLEEIDYYTSNFYDKKELIDDMNLKGNKIDPNSDLFIVYKSKGKLQTKELLYKTRRNYNIRENIKLSLDGDILVCYFIFKKVFELSKEEDFDSLLNSYEYGIYKDFKDLLSKCDKDIDQVSFDKNNAWLRSSYNNLRDLCVLMDDYDKSPSKSSYIILSKKNNLNDERSIIFDELEKAYDDGFGQYSWMRGPENYIYITTLNKEKMPTKYVLKNGKNGSIKPKEPEIKITNMPSIVKTEDNTEYKLDLDSIEKVNLCFQSSLVKQKAVKEMVKFLTNDYYMPSEAIKIKDDKYYIDFDVFDYDYSEEEKGELSSLMSQNMMKLVKGFKICNDRMKESFSASAVSFLEEDRNAFRKDIKRYLEKYADKNSKSLNKIYRFFQIQKEVIDNTKGRKR